MIVGYNSVAPRYRTIAGDGVVSTCLTLSPDRDGCVQAMNTEIVQSPLVTEFAEWAASSKRDFPDPAIRQARLSFLDTFACMTAGRNEPVVRAAADAMLGGGASGPVGTIVEGVSLSAPAAATVNGAAAHALDFDDYEIPASTHPSAVLVPALLAISDLRPVSIGDLATAYLVGYEAIVRVGRALGGYRHYLAGWHATSTVGPVGAAAAVAKLIRLDSVRFANALSLSMSTSAA